MRPNPDLFSFIRPIAVGLGHEPDPADTEHLAELIDPERAHSAFEDGNVVGSAGAYSFELTVPGGVAPAAGVAYVGVLPSHRRRGILRELMRVQLDDVRARGEPIACLWPSEERIYGSFGYAIASLGASIDMPSTRAGFRDDPGPSGRVRLLDETEAATAVPAIYEHVRRERPGMVSRTEAWWRLRRIARPAGATDTRFRAVWEDGAYALYRVSLPWFTVANGVVEVEEALGASVDATREIWRFLFSLDLVERVKAYRLPLDHPLFLMLQEPRRLDMRVADNLWVRLVDVEGAFAARALGDGSVVLAVTDVFLPQNAGRWRLGGEGVERTSDEPEIAVDVADLAAVYLGAFSFADLARSGRAHELRAGALARADAIVAWDAEPWCPEVF